MHDKLIQYINTVVSTRMPAEEEAHVRSLFKPRSLRKHQFYLQEGEVCSTAGFIVKGSMKQYSVDASGKESIINLFIENWWVGDRESFSTGKPTQFFIQACEPVDMLCITRNDFENHMGKMPIMGDMMRILTERQSFALLRRVNSAISHTAEQRLAEIEKNSPALLQRFPQHIIASYLGMTKETLSRIRSHSVKK